MRTFTLLISLIPSLFMQQEGASRRLTRTVYLPIRFDVCEHFTEAFIYESDKEGDERMLLGSLPSKRVFPFTYYPNLSRFEPGYYIVKIVGNIEEDYSNFQFITITNGTIYLSRAKSMTLDKDGKVAKRLRFSRDVRYKPQFVKIKCDKYPHSDDKEKKEED